MAANIENVSNEKDVGSLQSSVRQSAPVGAARNLDERRRAALSHIDNANFSLVFFLFVGLISFFVLTFSLCSWFHFKVICVAGVGFFTDA